jgi:excisionase family DNA binding protein
MKKTFDPTQWMSQSAAAAARKVSRQAIAKLVAKGRFTTLEVGGRTLLKRSEVESFKAQRPGPAPKKKRSR